VTEKRDDTVDTAGHDDDRTSSDDAQMAGVAWDALDPGAARALGEAIGLSAYGVDAMARWLLEPRYLEVRPRLRSLVARARGGDATARDELQDAFARPLPIGTGGRRGTCGVGPNRVDALLVRETAQGVVAALDREGLPRKVAVVYDTRRDSRMFAYVAAAQVAANGVETILVDAPRPTPQLSFLARRWGCGAGIVISASHNPPSDNGIKIYGPDGAQVIGARDRALMEAIETAATSALPEIPTTAARILAAGIERIDPDAAPEQADEPYLAWVVSQGVYPAAARADLRVVFTPLHGVGHTSVVPVLRARGIGVTTVARQVDPDEGRFSTVASANPELPAAMDMAVAQARQHDADLVLATDPDADRIGACARRTTDASGFEAIDGNRLGVLMLDHVLRRGDVQSDGWIITTTVTTPLISSLAEAAGVECVDDLLVGFKHHAAMVAEAPRRPVVFACEESHGYVRGREVRDKDGAVGALLLAECAADCKQRGQTLFDRLDEIWMQHGYHRETTTSIWAKGAAGRTAIGALMAAWREAAPTTLAGLEVREVNDRSAPRDTGSVTRDLPGNVLAFELASPGYACRVVLRPSGTEPKVKLYVLARGRGPLADAAALRDQIGAVDSLVERVATDAKRLADAVMAPHLAGTPAEGAKR